MQIKTTFHFTHKSIGKATHSARAASANVFYITRDAELHQAQEGVDASAYGLDVREHGPKPAASTKQATDEAVSYNARDSAASVVMAGRMPEGRAEAARWLDNRAGEDRANARIADTFIMSLPRELTREQNAELVRDWCEGVTKGQAAYFAAIHDKGKDAANPHVHIIIRDRDYSKDYEREKDRPRVIGTSTGRKEISEAARRGVEPPPMATTKDLRATWAEATNRHLERAGVAARVDHRSYKERGMEREAGIHIGRAGPRMEARGVPIQSRDVQKGERLMPYSTIDAGTRAEHNQRIREANARRELRRDEQTSARDVTGQAVPAAGVAGVGNDRVPMNAQERARFVQAETQRHDRAAMFAEQRLDTASVRTLQANERASLKQWAKTAGDVLQGRIYAEVGERFKASWASLDGQASGPEKQAAAAALRAEQAAAFKAAMRAARAELRAQKQQRQADMAARHKQQREALGNAHRDEQRLTYQQHHAERAGLLEAQAKGAAAKSGAQLAGSQSMPAVQGSQIAMMKRRAAERQRQAMQPKPMQPMERASREAETSAIESNMEWGRKAAAYGEQRASYRRVAQVDIAGREMTSRQVAQQSREGAREVLDSRASTLQRETSSAQHVKHGKGTGSDRGSER